MAQNDAGLISGKIRELTRLIRETRLAETQAFGPSPISNASTDELSDNLAHELEIAHGIAEKSAQKIRSHTKLEALSQALKGVYAEIPHDERAWDNAFTFAMLPGNPPRFWVDLSSFVVMVNKGEAYQFVKDTRDGRDTLFESISLEPMVDAITDYVAKRIVRQDVAGEPAFVPKEATQAAQKQSAPLMLEPEAEELAPQTSVAKAAPTAKVPEVNSASDTEQPSVPDRMHAGVLSQPIIIQPAPAKTDWVKLFLAFSLGVFVGAVVLFLMAWFQTPSAS